jgi:hypothetical protein
MIQSDSDEGDNELAEEVGIPFPVSISPELSELLKPNTFLLGLGIEYSTRIKTVFEILKGNLIPKEECIPKDGIVIPFSLVKGPFIKEELISIRAEVKDDSCKKTILLTAIPEEN